MLSLLGFGVKGLRIVRFFWLTAYTYVFVAGGQAYFLVADLPTRSMRVMRLYFLFLVREKWQPEKYKNLKKNVNIRKQFQQKVKLTLTQVLNTM